METLKKSVKIYKTLIIKVSLSNKIENQVKVLSIKTEREK